MRLDPLFVVMLQNDEGYRASRYKDTEGHWTIGYGHKWREGGDKVFTVAQAYAVLLDDIWLAEVKLEKALPWVKDLDHVRYGVLVLMTFNMGIGSKRPARGLLGFTKTLPFIKAGKYKEAGAEMLKSKWAKQVKDRAKRLARYMERGEIC